jgi:predicted nicotinamide N-methyase
MGSSPVWHLLQVTDNLADSRHDRWNTSRVLTDYLLRNLQLVKGQRICELGAGAGLPSLVSTLVGADRVVVTDYPDEGLIENLRWNAECNLPLDLAFNLHVQVCPIHRSWAES